MIIPIIDPWMATVTKNAMMSHVNNDINGCLGVNVVVVVLLSNTSGISLASDFDVSCWLDKESASFAFVVALNFSGIATKTTRTYAIICE